MKNLKEFINKLFSFIESKNKIKQKYKDRMFDKIDNSSHIYRNQSILYNKLSTNTLLFNEKTIKDVLGKRWKYHLHQIVNFIDIYKDSVPNSLFNQVEISTNARCFESLGSIPTVASIIKICEKIGLLKCVNKSYCFTGEYSTARKYHWNRNIEKHILCLADILNITSSEKEISHNLRYYESLVEKSVKKYRKNKDIKNILKKNKEKTYISKRLSFEYIDDGSVWNDFFNNYGFVKSYMRIIERNNSKEDDVNNKDILRLKIKRSDNGKKVKSLSVRMFNSYCNMKKVEREKKLNDEWGVFYCYDMNGSIYRITNGMNKYLIDLDSSDIYGYIADELDIKNDKNLRKKVKKLMMNLYFCHSYKEARNSLFYIGMNSNDQYNLLPEYRNEFLNDLGYLRKGILRLKNEFIEKYEKEFLKLYFKLREKIGVSWNSEIFLHESCIYTLVKNELLRKGFKCILVYDAFYIDKYLDEDSFKRIVEKCARKYFKRLRKWIERRRKHIIIKFEKIFRSNVKKGLTYNKRVNRFIRKNIIKSKDLLNENIYECIEDILRTEKIRELYKIVICRFVFRPYILGKILDKNKTNKKLSIEKYIYDT